MLRPIAYIIAITLLTLTLAAENEEMKENPITEWLMIGPYPIHERSQVLNWPFLPEKELAPSPNETIGSLTWKKVNTSGIMVDLFQVGFPTVDSHAAYAFTYARGKERGDQAGVETPHGMADEISCVNKLLDLRGGGHLTREKRDILELFPAFMRQK